MVRPDPRYGETISLSSQTIKILNDIQNGLISVPDWFNNNIGWVQDGHMTEQEFITSYDYLITSGIAHTTITAPEPVAPAPEPVSLYWVQKPSQQPYGRPEAYHLTESTKQKWLSQGYIIATMEPKYQGEQILWESAYTQFPSGMQTSQLGERYRIVTDIAAAQAAAAEQQAAEQAAQAAALPPQLGGDPGGQAQPSPGGGQPQTGGGGYERGDYGGRGYHWKKGGRVDKALGGRSRDI